MDHLQHCYNDNEIQTVQPTALWGTVSHLSLQRRDCGGLLCSGVRGNAVADIRPHRSQDMSGSRMVNPEDNILRPVKIHYLMKVSFLINTSHTKHICFVGVSWFQPHPYRFEIGKPAQVWCYQQFESHGQQSFLPVHNLCSRCVHSIIKVHKFNENVLVLVYTTC